MENNAHVVHLEFNCSYFSPVLPVSAPVQTPGPCLTMSQSAGAVSLQQAFFEIKQNQNQFDAGPSTAPASIHSTHPPLPPAAATLSSQSSVVPYTVDVTAGPAPSNLNQPQDQILESPLPPLSSSSSTPSSSPTVCVSPPCTTSPSSTVMNQSIRQSQSGMQAMPKVQGQAQIQQQTFSQPQQTVSAVIANSIPSSLPPASIPPTMLPSPPPTQATALLCSPPAATEVSSDHPSISPTTSSNPSLTSSDTPTTAIPGSQHPHSAPCHPIPLSSSSSNSGLQPVTTIVPTVQPTLVHSQPQTVALPGQTHNHCGECDVR